MVRLPFGTTKRDRATSFVPRRMNHDPIPAEGDFSFIADEVERMVYEDLYTAITHAEAWTLLDVEPGPESGGFQFNVKPYQAIYTALIKIDRVGHTGASLASAMRIMQILRRIGWPAFVKERRP